MRQINVLMIMLLMSSIALQSTRPIVSLFAHSLGLSSAVIGLLVAVFSFFPMILAVRIGIWLDKYGPRTMIIIGAAGSSVALLLPVLFPGITTLFISQMIIGSSHICSLISLQKTVWNQAVNRDKAIATFSFLAAFGGLFGPLMSGYSYQHLGFQATYGMALMFTFTGLITAICLKNIRGIKINHQEKGAEDKKSHWRKLKEKDIRNAILIGAIVVFSKDLFVAYFPVYAENIGYSASMIGVIIAVLSASMMVIRLLQFHLVKLLARGKLLLFALAACGVAYLIIPFTLSLYKIIMIIILLGSGLGLGQPLSLFFVLQNSSKEIQGAVLGIRTTMNRALQFAAPLLFGGIGFIGGISSIFYCNAAFLIIGSYFTRMTDAKKADKADRNQASGING